MIYLVLVPLRKHYEWWPWSHVKSLVLYVDKSSLRVKKLDVKNLASMRNDNQQRLASGSHWVFPVHSILLSIDLSGIDLSCCWLHPVAFWWLPLCIPFNADLSDKQEWTSACSGSILSMRWQIFAGGPFLSICVFCVKYLFIYSHWFTKDTPYDITERLAIHPYKLFLRPRKWRNEWGYKYWISETTWIDNLEIVGQLKLQKMVKLSGNWYLVKTRFICRGAVGDASPSLPLMTLMRRKKLAFKEIICSFFYSNQGHQMRGKGKHTSKKRKSGIILIFRS